MTQNAPVLKEHRDEAAMAHGYNSYASADNYLVGGLRGQTMRSIYDHAQAIANIEALNNRLAEIERLFSVAMAEINDLCKLNPTNGTVASIQAIASRFIIPPADPVAEALKALIAEHGVEVSDAGFDAMLAWHKGELSRLSSDEVSKLGGAK